LTNIKHGVIITSIKELKGKRNFPIVISEKEVLDFQVGELLNRYF